jgi:Tol biopolymer transport system component
VWSPDGRQLAFQSDEHADMLPTGFGAQSGSTIWMVDADGGNPRPVSQSGDPGGGHAAPSWSADGRFLAFTVFEAGAENGLWVLNLATRKTTLLAQGSGLFESVFAPDGAAVYVAGGAAFILRVPFDGVAGVASGPTASIPVPGVPGVRGVSISPDGRQISFAGLTLDSQIWSQRLGPDGRPLGASAALTSDTSQRNSLPSISPDGSRVVYTSTRRGELPNVWVMNIDGGSPVQLTAEEAGAYQPSWLPDGRQVAYYSVAPDRRGLRSVDLATRRATQLLELPRNIRGDRPDGRLAEMDLSPSAARVAFSLLRPPLGRRTLYVADLESLEPRALTDGTESVGYPAWSPDETRIAVEIKDGSSTQAGVIDLETGTLRRLTRDRGQTWPRSWSPDGRRIAAAVLRNGLWSLRWIDAGTGEQGALTPPAPAGAYVRYPEWSPLGDVVLFERAEMRGNIWTLNLR